MSDIPHTSPGRWPVPLSESRLAYHIRWDDPAGCQVALLGLADDLGVRLNHGRPGAKDGPTALRSALARYGVADPYGWKWPRIYDAGDIIPADGDDESALHETHRRVTEAASALLEQGLFPIGIGGGHDLTFPFVRAIAHRLRQRNSAPAALAGYYCDAHLDVREEAGSGMPFRKLITECGVRPLHVFGLNALNNTREHWNWFEAHGGVVAESELPEDDQFPPAGPAFVSIDLDVLDSAFAPGVSAINPSGWQPWHLEDWAHQAGMSQQVQCFDIMELNPSVDQDGRTARIAAHLLLTFLRGFAERGG